MSAAFRFFFFFLFLIAPQWYSQLSFSEEQIDLGNIAEAFEIKGDLVVKNNSNRKVFLMRADAEKGLKVYTSKRTLAPYDTCLLIISFSPEQKGKFNKKIELVASDRDQPYRLHLSGVLQKLNTDNKMACYYFGRNKNKTIAAKEQPVVVNDTFKQRDVSNKMPGSPPVVKTNPKPKVINDSEKKSEGLSEEDYRPNNVLFLVDVSSSMRDSLKLPIMKNALHTLISSMREMDSLTFITYADTVKVLREAISGTKKEDLNNTVDKLKAKGMTKGRKAIFLSQQVAQKHFVPGGNNQIIILTDGKFRFEKEDYSLWKSRQGNKPIILSTVAFGDDREALQNLREIARKGNGSFIHIRKETGYEQKLLEEIKERSKIHSR